MTGVRRSWRNRGLATALKLRAIDAAQAWGATRLRTVHHPNNDAIIAANPKLGFATGTSIYRPGRHLVADQYART